MKGIIKSYDQVKGRGVFLRDDGQETAFTYREFADERMIPPGEPAEFINGILHPRTLNKWQRLLFIVKEVLKTWLSRLRT